MYVFGIYDLHLIDSRSFTCSDTGRCRCNAFRNAGARIPSAVASVSRL